MGLDMYLTAKRYIWNNEQLKQQLMNVMNTDYDVKYVDLEIGYWRKANQVHKWFVDNIQDGEDDCGEYYVSNEQLVKLLNTCKKALETKSPNMVMPTQSGFFFGSTDYGEEYESDLKSTIAIIEKYLRFPDKDKYELYYHSSW